MMMMMMKKDEHWHNLFTNDCLGHFCDTIIVGSCDKGEVLIHQSINYGKSKKLLLASREYKKLHNSLICSKLQDKNRTAVFN